VLERADGALRVDLYRQLPAELRLLIADFALQYDGVDATPALFNATTHCC
jgi:hypothetical protein